MAYNLKQRQNCDFEHGDTHLFTSPCFSLCTFSIVTSREYYVNVIIIWKVYFVATMTKYTGICVCETENNVDDLILIIPVTMSFWVSFVWTTK